MNTLKIVLDNNPSNPRSWDNLGTIAYKHRNYDLGEEKIDEPIEWLEDKLNLSQGFIYSNERLEQLEEKFYKKFVALPLYFYEHSSCSIKTTSFNCKWDSGKIGYIYATKKQVLKELGSKIVTEKLREQVLSIFRGEIETFDHYVRGDIYGFVIEDEEGNPIDSCFGFYGENWEDNGLIDHIDLEELNLETKEQLLELLKQTEIEY